MALVKLVTMKTNTNCFAGGFAAYMIVVVANDRLGNLLTLRPK